MVRPVTFAALRPTSSDRRFRACKICCGTSTMLSSRLARRWKQAWRAWMSGKGIRGQRGLCWKQRSRSLPKRVGACSERRI